jgi:hypothetical protein
MHIHPNAIPDYVAIKAIAMISVVAIIIDNNILLRGNNHDYCNNIKNCRKVLLQCYHMQPLLTKVTLLPLEGIPINMTLLQPYFNVAIDRFSSSELNFQVTATTTTQLSSNSNNSSSAVSAESLLPS